MNVVYLSHAQLQPGAMGKRLKRLMRDLEAHGCKTRLRYGAKRLDFEILDREERWIVLGGLGNLFKAYEDAVAWSPNFKEKKV